MSLLLFAGLALVFALLLLVGLSTLVLILFWDTYRLARHHRALRVLHLGMRLLRHAPESGDLRRSSPFHGTLEELANDRERLLP